MDISLYFDPETETVPVELPLSKSVALRVMTLNAVSERLNGRGATIPQLPDAEDVKGMERAMECYRRALGNDRSDNGSYEAFRVNIGDGGAPFRFFTALAASTPGVDITLLTGKPLIRRPHAILLDTLCDAGAEIHPLRRPGRPPLRIIGKRLAPGRLSMNPGVSSQYISALMMVSPLWEGGLDLDFHGETPVSLPYLRMTADVMRRFGCLLNPGDKHIEVVSGQCMAPEEYEIPVDWSAASYFYELALLLPGCEIPLERLTVAADSLQGDSACESIFSRLGVSTIYRADGSAILKCSGRPEYDDIFVLDLNGTPDLAPALAVGFCLAGIRFRFDHVAHLRHKETDRMAALACELRKLGYRLFTGDDSMGWCGEMCDAETEPEISTYSDHRMAMAFAPAAVKFPGLRITDPEVVGKSFPRYWDALSNIGFRIIKA